MLKIFTFIVVLLSSSCLVADNNVRDIEHFWITLADGTRLAARMWLPENADRNPVPAILEYIPYRKRDGTRGRDESMHHWFASKGYAAIRVDMRGSGESDGLLYDEYLKLEQDDALEVIDWISKQPWCTGAVGMMGKSWGGFNSLQVAARRPPALKAIITLCTTDDRYADDIHYMGGCLLNDNLWWGAIMLAYQSLPPDPALVGVEWRQKWLERIDQMPFWPALWVKNQHRNDYWRQGSICEDWSAIECPVFIVDGWGDAYINTVSRLLENLQTPRLGLIGPWAHLYPHSGVPGPAIGFLQEACRWWDQWLKGVETGIMDEPMFRAYMEEWTPPVSWRDHKPGRWVGEAEWPSRRIEKRRLYFASSGLDEKASDYNAELTIHSPQWTGSTAGEWMGIGVPGEMPVDQRFDDGCSLTFDTEVLVERMELLGAPEVILQMASDKPLAQLCVRLCDVDPSGSSRRVSYQVMNLTHRESHADPEPLEPGRFYEIKVKLNDCGYAFSPGHRLRIALSTTYWPMVWPAPEAATLTLRTQNSTLALPVRPPSDEDALIRFEQPEKGPETAVTKVEEGKSQRFFNVDFLSGNSIYVTECNNLFSDHIYIYDDIGIVTKHQLRRALTINADDPLSARNTITQTYHYGREGWDIRIESNVEMTATGADFHITGSLDVYENGEKTAARLFEETIPRDCL